VSRQRHRSAGALDYHGIPFSRDDAGIFIEMGRDVKRGKKQSGRLKDEGCAPVDPVAGYFCWTLLAVTGAVCYYQSETRQLAAAEAGIPLLTV